ncbi:MAG TPA: hypothetical protein VK348_12630 [Planctomycetota bacterium]|nr:hypothetical protein [Planctomycetota bacterium]
MVVRTATTPAEARVLVALLQAEGIPAHVDGDSLSDEVAVSRRLMNLNGVRVQVPADLHARALEILANCKVDDTELEQQALSAADPESEPPPTRPATGLGHARNLALLVTSIAAVLFFCLWMAQRERDARGEDPLFVSEWTNGTLRTRWRSNGKLAQERFLTGSAEEVRAYNHDGGLTSVAIDRNGDGNYEQREFHFPGDMVLRWTDLDGDGRYDRCETLDAAGKVLRTQRFVAGQGLVDEH